MGLRDGITLIRINSTVNIKLYLLKFTEVVKTCKFQKRTNVILKSVLRKTDLSSRLTA